MRTSPRTPRGGLRRSVSKHLERAASGLQGEDDEEAPLAPVSEQPSGYGSTPAPSLGSLGGFSLRFRSVGSVLQTIRTGALDFLAAAKDPSKVRDWVKGRAQGLRRRLQGEHFDLVSMENKYIEPFLLVVTLLNALVIGVEIDAPHHYTALHWLAINTAFNLVFTIEIELKLLAYGVREYFKSAYNIFSFVLTVLAWIEILGSLFLHFALSPQMAYKLPELVPSDLVQILRMFRVVKLASIYPTFGTLLDSFVMACGSLAWVLMLALLYLFLAACMGVVFIGRIEDREGEKTEGLKEVKEGFASIPEAMWMLFELMMMESWSDQIRPFLTRQPILVPVMLAFLVVSNFFILNLITAVVVDRMQRAQNESEEHKAIEHETETEEGMRDLFSRLLTLNEGEDVVTFENLMGWAREDKSVRHLMRSLRWSVRYLKESFRLCDHDYNQKASLLAILGIWVGCREQMTCELYAKFQSHVAARMDYLDELGTAAMQQTLKFVETRSKRE